MIRKLYLLLLLLSCYSFVFSQQNSSNPFVTISGTVYDVTARKPLEAVAVISTSGRGTVTDSLGRYSLTIKSTDSIWFSMLNKTTVKYPVDTIKNTSEFNIMIHVRAADLPEVRVRNSNYKLDSIQNRNDYAKYFNFKKPSIQLNKGGTGFGPSGYTVGLDLDEIINMFRFRRNRNLEALQRRLVEQEQNKYVDHRYSKQFVRKITKLQSPELEAFMQRYKPNYDFLLMLNDLELGYYIEKCYDQYKEWRKIPHN